MALMIELFPEHLQAIGTIAVRWSSVDRVMHDILLLDFAMSEDAQILRACNAGVSRLELFKSRVEKTNIVERSNLVAAAVRLVELAKERNLIVHGQYGVIVGDDGALAASWSDIGLKKGGKDFSEGGLVTTEHLLGHADDVKAASEPLRAYRYRAPT
ncbi:MAG: hypothetical protein P0Y59_01810 [Candidatus Sphingomonas phytovorans]|nr:hypothetical protein [Sphingomonas sp.]WEK00459.1 MAG: hypothetical protein P0Y59_01810 [Sphingomonas sp.]